MPSIPTFHRTRMVSSGYISPDDEVAGIFDDMQSKGYPGALNVLKIMRGASEEEDRHAKEKRSRNFQQKNNNISILEGIQKYSGSSKGMHQISELQHAQRRGRFGSKKRGWR